MNKIERPKIYFKTKADLPDEVKVVKYYWPSRNLIYCKYSFRNYGFVFDIDMTQNDPYIISSVRLSPLVTVHIPSEKDAYVSIDFFIGSTKKKNEFLKVVNDAFDLCEIAPAIIEDVKEAYKLVKEKNSD